MPDAFFVKRGDRLRYLRRTLTDEDGNLINLTGASVKFYMKDMVTGELTINGAAAVIVNAPGTDGVVEYRWAAVDTDTEGSYLAEFEVTIAGLPQTFPNDGYITVTILPDVRAWTATDTAYATVAMLRAEPWNMTEAEADDDAALAALVASRRRIDDYTGTTFDAEPSTIEVTLLNYPLVPLPLPFFDVTAVTLDGVALEADGWSVEPWGLRIKRCPVGYLSASYLTGGESWFQGVPQPVPSKASVTATFGYTWIPQGVEDANLILASRRIRRKPATGGASSVGGVASESMQAFSRTWLAQSASERRDSRDTTGDLEVDALLERWRSVPRSHVS